MADLENPTINSLNVFEGPNVHIHDKLEIIQMDGQTFVFAPWHENHEMIANFVNKIPSSEKAGMIFMGHLALEGSRIFGANDTSGTICSRSGIKIEDLCEFKRAFLGHFHLHSTFANNKILYVGSLCQSDFGESGNLDKGFVEYNPLEDLWTLERQPYASKYITIQDSQIEHWMKNAESKPDLTDKKVRVLGVLKGNVSDQTRITRYSRFLKESGTKREHFPPMNFTSFCGAGSVLLIRKEVSFVPANKILGAGLNTQNVDNLKQVKTLPELLQQWENEDGNVCSI